MQESLITLGIGSAPIDLTAFVLLGLTVGPVDESSLSLWIDVEDAAGNKLGSGPIRDFTGWRNVRRLSRAGTFEFEMPASDPKAAALALKRVVRCYGIINGQQVDLGNGVIDQMTLVPQRSGAAMLRVSGDDLLRELTYRTVGTLELVADDTNAADMVARWTGGSSATLLANAYDGNAGTSVTITGWLGDYLLVGSATPFDRISLTISSANLATSTLTAAYHNGVAPLSNSGFVALTISDGTRVGSATMAQTGIVTFTMPTDWVTTTIQGETLYFVGLRWLNGSVSFDLAEVSTVVDGPTTTALADVMDYAPAGWDWDPAGYNTTAGAVAATFSGQNVLEALVNVAETLGEDFILGAGRSVRWLRNESITSPLRAVQINNWVAAANADELALITALETVNDGYEIVTRVYAYGGEVGDRLLDLNDGTALASAGYTLDRANNYLEHDAGVLAYGRIDRTVQFTDIIATGTVGAPLIAAGDALLTKAELYLARNAVPYANYRLSVTNTEGNALTPGMLIPVSYHEWRDGIHAVDIDEDLLVIETTTEVTRDGVRTIALQVATVSGWSHDEQAVIAQLLNDSNKATTSSSVITITGGTGATSLSGLDDVNVDAAPADNEVMAYDATTYRWINQTAVEAGLTAATLTTKGDLLTWDTALARLGVGTNTHVLTADSVQALGIKWAAATADAGDVTHTPRIVDDTATEVAGNSLIVCNKATAFTLTLLAATGGGRQLVVKNIGLGVVTVDAAGAETIDGQTTQTLNQYDSMTIVDYAAGVWAIV